LDRLVTESDRVGVGRAPSVPTPLPNDDTGCRAYRPETVALWVKLVATMGLDYLADFGALTFRT
jgi:hypothetical protein